MAEFSIKNKGPLTLLVIFICALLMIADGFIENEANTTIQWAIFGLGVLALMYIHLMADALNEAEYGNEIYMGPELTEKSLQDKQVEELEKDFDLVVKNNTNETISIPVENGIGLSLEDKEKLAKLHAGWKPNPDGSASKTIFVVQPITVTQDELKDKIEELTNNNETNNIDMDTKNQNKELPKALVNPDIVIGYSLHNINKKHRSMYADICGFAIGPNPKKESEITAKVTSYGYKFTTERSNKNTIAFNIECEPKVRIPEKGYFEVKA